jgi:hypothetical protein
MFKMMFGGKMEEVSGAGEKCIMRSFIIHTHQLLLG